MNSLLDRITIDPAICHGKPCLRGLRYPVEMLLELLSSGTTIEEILADYSDLEREDLLAALSYVTRPSAWSRIGFQWRISMHRSAKSSTHKPETLGTSKDIFQFEGCAEIFTLKAVEKACLIWQ